MSFDVLSDGRYVSRSSIVNHEMTTVQTHNAVVNPSNNAGAWIDCRGKLYINAICNIASTFKIEWSNNGSTVAGDETSGASVKLYKTFVVMPYARVVLTATGTATAYATLQA